MSAQPRDIPGFYYDPDRNKYFRIQANHQVPPSGTSKGSSTSKLSKYTKQAVNTAKRHARESQRYQSMDDRKRAENVQRSYFLKHPVYGLDLRIRSGSRKTVGDDVRRQYAWMLRSNTVMGSGKLGDKFAVEKGSKALFTTAEVESRGRGAGMREMCVTPLSLSREQGDEDKNMDDSSPMYLSTTTVPILNSNDATTILPLSERLVMWSFHRPDDPQEGSVLCISKKYADENVPWQNWREEFGEWGTNVRQTCITLWDFAVPKVDENGTCQPQCFVTATRNGVKIYDFEYGVSGVNDVVSRGPDEQLSKTGERLVVSFKDENVFMAGGRSGSVLFGDVRANSSVTRLKHGGAISGLRKMRNECLILVNGLEKMGMYDIRYNCGKGSTKKKPLAEMVLDFDVPESMQQKRCGLGFDYDEELNVAASACTDFGSKHKVGLWDCGTGQRIQEGALTQKEFFEPVTCLQMLDLRGQSQSAKSILTKSGGVIEEWHV